MDDAGRLGAGLCRAAGLVPASEIVLRERPVASEQAVSAQPRRVRSRHHADTVAELADAHGGRSRMRPFNVLKTNGYNLEHNLGARGGSSLVVDIFCGPLRFTLQSAVCKGGRVAGCQLKLLAGSQAGR